MGRSAKDRLRLRLGIAAGAAAAADRLGKQAERPACAVVVVGCRAQPRKASIAGADVATVEQKRAAAGAAIAAAAADRHRPATAGRGEPSLAAAAADRLHVHADRGRAEDADLAGVGDVDQIAIAGQPAIGTQRMPPGIAARIAAAAADRLCGDCRDADRVAAAQARTFAVADRSAADGDLAIIGETDQTGIAAIAAAAAIAIDAGAGIAAETADALGDDAHAAIGADRAGIVDVDIAAVTAGQPAPARGVLVAVIGKAAFAAQAAATLRDDAERRRPAGNVEADIVGKRDETRVSAQATVAARKRLAPGIAARAAIAAVSVNQNARAAGRISARRLVGARIDGQVHDPAIAAVAAIASAIDAAVVIDVVAAVPARTATTADDRDRAAARRGRVCRGIGQRVTTVIGRRPGGTIAAGACATGVVLPVVLARRAVGTMLPFEIGGVAVIDDHLRPRFVGGRNNGYRAQTRCTQPGLAPLRHCRGGALEHGYLDWHDWLPSTVRIALSMFSRPERALGVQRNTHDARPHEREVTDGASCEMPDLNWVY